MGRISTEQLDVVDTIAIGPLTMLVIEIPASANTFNFTASETIRHASIPIASLGLSEIYSANIMCRGPKPLKVDRTKLVAGLTAPLKDSATGSAIDFTATGLQSDSSDNDKVNIEPLVYIDQAENNLIIESTFYTMHAVNNNLGGANSRDVILTIIGRRG